MYGAIFDANVLLHLNRKNWLNCRDPLSLSFSFPPLWFRSFWARINDDDNNNSIHKKNMNRQREWERERDRENLQETCKTRRITEELIEKFPYSNETKSSCDNPKKKPATHMIALLYMLWWMYEWMEIKTTFNRVRENRPVFLVQSHLHQWTFIHILM